MPFTKHAVELFISARASAVTTCGAADMQAKVPESMHWLSNIGISVIFNDHPPEPMRPFAINFVRRVSAAFVEYRLAREQVLSLVKDGHGRWSPYFAALTHFEVAIAQLYLALDSVRKLAGHDFFKTGDGSFEECMNLLYNASKHQLALKELPLWFTNDGVSCSEASLSFEDIEDFMLRLADVVAALHNKERATKALAP